ncbi:MAG: hypothetical protein ACOC56_03120 [Atribacterota bacterium]
MNISSKIAISLIFIFQSTIGFSYKSDRSSVNSFLINKNIDRTKIIINKIFNQIYEFNTEKDSHEDENSNRNKKREHVKIECVLNVNKVLRNISRKNITSAELFECKNQQFHICKKLNKNIYKYKDECRFKFLTPIQKFLNNRVDLIDINPIQISINSIINIIRSNSACKQCGYFF